MDAHRDVLELSIQSSYALLDKVSGVVEEAASRIGLPEDQAVDLMISVMEAVNNAILHGNREDESKQVHVRIETEPSRVTIWVKDEGEGFDADSLPDPREPENLLKVAGRGIVMMKAFMDDVEFQNWERGTLVKMTKQFTQD